MNGTPFAVATLALPGALNVTIDDDTLSVDLEDGRTISVPIGWYPRLAHGTPPSPSRCLTSLVTHLTPNATSRTRLIIGQN